MKLLHLLIAIGGALLLAVMATGIMAATTDFRTDVLEEEFSVITGVGETTATLQLDDTLWNDSRSYITSITSGEDTDNPSATSYNSTNRQVTISGLTANTTRVIALKYKSNALEDAEAAETIILHMPSALLVAVILIPVLALVALIVWVIRGRA